MKIAIDAMGGDRAPEVTVEGALIAAKEWPDTELILIGNEEKIGPLLKDRPANLRVHHCTEEIGADEEPARSVRRKKDASMVVAGRLVREKAADAMISAGNTGSLMATGLLVIGRIRGIDRPALAPMIPTLDGSGVLALDLGANMDATAEQLLQYAVMGSIYREKVQGIKNPRVGLLNVGTEAMKGNELSKEAFALLEEAPIRFIGNVEARDVLQGRCDVLVCDGFVGNILLKSMEGTFGAVFELLKREFTRSLPAKLAAAVLKPGLKQLKRKLDYTEHGGAPLLGIDGVCIKSHGSSDAIAIKNGIRQARTAVENGLIRSISEGI